ncbi:DNA repair protein RecN [Piscinibacter sp.]|uniref:DNA repair protein RecN n=1 Tax=Piscinibacter sp. TaxID=1903157 RepID=UPI002BE12FA4|nr:DNA repair protein RecN [Albitalea sp.]HUG23200.1 DNA repair protein RecN [Albitalea sp.]
MLRRLALRDFVIVSSLEVELDAGFSVLTGETGAGKSILVDAVQLALGSRGDAGVVREGAARTEISAEFDAPATLARWLEDAGFDAGDTLLLRRTIDAQGKSRAWVNGSPATIAQLREAAEHLVDIHGQHAWQSLTRGVSVRALLDAYAGVNVAPLAETWSRWKAAADALQHAQAKQVELSRERERLTWQIGEVDKLAPGDGEWDELNGEHQRLANAQSLIDAARTALDAVNEGDDNAESLTGRAMDALQQVAGFDARLAGVIDALQGAQAQLQDAAHTLSSYLHHTDVEPERLQEVDERMSAWMGLARRYRRPPADLAELLAEWKSELVALDAAADLDGLQRKLAQAQAAFDAQAKQVSAARRQAAPKLAAAVTQAMQQLGMAGGRFEVSLLAQEAPQSFGLESAEFLVAGHEGSTPRPLAKVASGGELSRIALAIAVTTSQLGEAGTLIFDEIDAGVGGAVAETVGRLMKQLGRDRQVMAVTHLPQVAACADHHFVVSKSSQGGTTRSDVQAVLGEARVAEIARMLGGERLSGTSVAHAQEMLAVGAETAPPRRKRT